MNTKTKSSVQLSNQHGSILLNGLGHAWIQTNAHGFPCRLSLLDHPIPNPATPDPATTGWLQRLLQWWQDPSIQLAACPLPQGTPWQQQVWSLLTTIPSGATRSYSEIALILGKPSAQRAVASACACNRSVRLAHSCLNRNKADFLLRRGWFRPALARRVRAFLSTG